MRAGTRRKIAEVTIDEWHDKKRHPIFGGKDLIREKVAPLNLVFLGQWYYDYPRGVVVHCCQVEGPIEDDQTEEFERMFQKAYPDVVIPGA